MTDTRIEFRMHSPAALAAPFQPLRGASAPRAAARRRRRWLRVGGLLLAGFVGLAGLAALGGAAYEAVAGAGDAARYPAEGRLVDIGGLRLHLDCRGAGSPTVVLDAGLGGASRDWALVQPALAETTRTCSYDRAGMGWSDAGGGTRTPRQLSDELWTLLQRAGERGPYVLVGHSLGGKTVRLVAASHPEAVAGMVLVDARSEVVDAATTPAEAEGFAGALRGQALLYGVARRLGLARLVGAQLIGAPGLSAETATELALLQTQPAAIEETVREGLARAADDAALAAAQLGDLPLVVVAASESLAHTPHWPEAQKALAGLSKSGRLVVAERSGHGVQLEQPEVVIAAVREVLAAAQMHELR